MNRQDLALLCAMAVACWLQARRQRQLDERHGDAPLPEWADDYLAAFDRLLRGDAHAGLVMRQITRENIAHVR